MDVKSEKRAAVHGVLYVHNTYINITYVIGSGKLTILQCNPLIYKLTLCRRGNVLILHSYTSTYANCHNIPTEFQSNSQHIWVQFHSWSFDRFDRLMCSCVYVFENLCHFSSSNFSISYVSRLLCRP